MAVAPSNEASPAWEHFFHGTNLGVRGYGVTPAAAFANAAMALTAIITEPDKVTSAASVTIVCGARKLETLLVDWLNALVYEMATRTMLFSRFDVQIMETDTGYRLAATAHGEVVDRLRRRPAVEVKGVMDTELKVATVAKDRWLAQCVVNV